MSLDKSSSEPLRIAFLANFTINQLMDYVDGFSVRHGINTISYTGGYDSFFQEVLDSSGNLVKFNPEFIFAAFSLKKLSPEIYYNFNALSGEKRQTFQNKIMETIVEWTGHALQNTNASIILCNFQRPCFNRAGIADLKDEFGETEFYYQLNSLLIKEFKSGQRIFLFDLDRLAYRYGCDKILVPKMYYLAKIEWNESFLPFVAEEIVRYLIAIKGFTKKCLVLDLDNTLWGGVVGEDGVYGIKVSGDDALGEAFVDFQRKILSIKERGILLAICSKNNLTDIEEVFAKRTDMPLKMDDFIIKKINWVNKHLNVSKIAQSLNIGLESIVFLDDNPAECELMKQMLPEVKTICLPRDPSEYPALLDGFLEFEKIKITREDSEKSLQYKTNFKRARLKKTRGTLSSYLESLKTKIVVRKAQKHDLERVHQLFIKTSQFNLTTKRYDPSQIEGFYNKKDFDLMVVEAKDCFGDLGTIGLFLMHLKRRNLIIIDSFILSCRAVGRGIETAVMNQIKDVYTIRSNQGKTIESLYVPTKKNSLVEKFYEEQGFELLSQDQGNHKNFRLIKTELLECSWIKFLTKEEFDKRGE